MQTEVSKTVKAFKSGKISRRDFIKSLALAGVSLSAADALLAGCAPSAAPPVAPGAQPSPTSPPSAEPTTLRFVWIGDINPQWHPSQYTTFSQWVIFSLIFSNLVKLDGTDLETVVPDLAESWEVSDDATQFTFNLQRGVKWHDGTPFTAKDVVFSFTSSLHMPYIRPNRIERVQGAAAYQAGQAESVEGIEQLDDYTVRITLERPDATFLWNMRDPEYVIVPEHILKDANPDQITNHPFSLKTPIGTGPYKFVQYQTDQFAEFEAFVDYFKGVPQVDKMFMKRLNSEVTVAQLESGEVDLALRLNPLEYERVSQIPSVNAISIPGVGNTRMLFTAERAGEGTVGDKRIRQAIYYAIDRKSIVDSVFQSRAEVLNGAPPALDHYDDLDPYEYNPDKAKALLEEAGFDFNAPFRIIYDQLYPAVQQYMPVVAQQLQTIGINVQLEPMETTAYIDRGRNRRDTFEARMGQGGDQGLHPDRTSTYYNCETIPGYQNCEMDELFVQARQTADPAEQDKIYHQIAKILNEDVPAAWLWQPHRLHAAVKGLGGGFAASEDPKTTFWNTHTWTLER